MHDFNAKEVLWHAAAVLSSGAFGFWSTEAASELQKQASKAAGAVTGEPLQACGGGHEADEPHCLGPIRVQSANIMMLCACPLLKQGSWGARQTSAEDHAKLASNHLLLTHRGPAGRYTACVHQAHHPAQVTWWTVWVPWLQLQPTSWMRPRLQVGAVVSHLCFGGAEPGP